MSHAIRTEELSKKYRHVDALNGISLSVPERAIYALVGPNGAGKTTALKLLMNILRPTSGRSEVLGIASCELSPHDFAVIGYVSENQEVPDWMRVNYLLAYLKPFYPAWDDGLADELVRQFDLPLERKIKHLSRGMRMKLALASSLAYRPELIVLDEPFTGLDPLVREQLTEGLLERAQGATVLISSHDLDDLGNFASHVGYLDGGRLRFSEEITSLLERFREVEVTCEAAPRVPADWPKNWICQESSSAVLRFIDSRFDSENTPAEVRRRFRDLRDVSFAPMSLRSIFVAFAKAANNAA
jgi:ABC-2 type transport system ATP-binding protein